MRAGTPTQPRPAAPLVLASASPRRHRLLREAGVAFEIRPADIDETPHPGESAAGSLRRLAGEKARRIASQLDEPGRLVLGADTGVVLGERLYGKPRDAAHAIELLGELLGHTHRVITAVALVASGRGQAWSFEVTSRVELRDAPREEIERYVAGGEPLDKAGAYALQGEGRRFVAKVEGSESNVIGLPLDETLALLERARRELETPA